MHETEQQEPRQAALREEAQRLSKECKALLLRAQEFGHFHQHAIITLITALYSETQDPDSYSKDILADPEHYGALTEQGKEEVDLARRYADFLMRHPEAIAPEQNREQNAGDALVQQLYDIMQIYETTPSSR